MVDYDDYALDDFDNFFLLERLEIFGQPIIVHNDKARSWKWYAPVGCSIQAIDHENDIVDETRTLVGTGVVERDPDRTKF